MSEQRGMNGDDKPDLLQAYLEIDSTFLAKQPTLKMMGDNLRNYPLAVALWVAVGYIWAEQNPWARAAALLWGLWLTWFTLLTVIQTGVLATMVAWNVITREFGVVGWVGAYLVRYIVAAIGGLIALVSFGSSLYLAATLYRLATHQLH